MKRLTKIVYAVNRVEARLPRGADLPASTVETVVTVTAAKRAVVVAVISVKNGPVVPLLNAKRLSLIGFQQQFHIVRLIPRKNGRKSSRKAHATRIDTSRR